jgi:hypothetical protein
MKKELTPIITTRVTVRKAESNRYCLVCGSRGAWLRITTTYTQKKSKLSVYHVLEGRCYRHRKVE